MRDVRDCVTRLLPCGTVSESVCWDIAVWDRLREGVLGYCSVGQSLRVCARLLQCVIGSEHVC